MSNLELQQKPIIKHDLIKVGAMITKRLEELNIDNIIANEDSYKGIKSLLTDLNKEFEELEKQRKIIKKAILSPYDEMEIAYKSHISEKYNNAINTLKTKRDKIELELKKAKEVELREYFNELILSENIDFIKFENIDLTINLSSTIKSYKEKINEFVFMVVDDLKLIDTQEHKAEILVEYKKSLNVSQSITIVSERIEAEKQEKERLLIERTEKRVESLKKLGLFYDDMIKSFLILDITISLEDVKNLDTDEFRKRYLEISNEVDKLNSSLEVYQKLPTPTLSASTPQAQPLQQPKEVKLFKASFEVEASIEDLKKLKNFLTENKFNFKTL